MHLDPSPPSSSSSSTLRFLLQLHCTDSGLVSVAAPQAVDSPHAAYMDFSVRGSWTAPGVHSKAGWLRRTGSHYRCMRWSRVLFKHTEHYVKSTTRCQRVKRQHMSTVFFLFAINIIQNDKLKNYQCYFSGRRPNVTKWSKNCWAHQTSRPWMWYSFNVLYFGFIIAKTAKKRSDGSRNSRSTRIKL